MRREFVVAAYVIDKGKVLLVNHKKLHQWLPLGGHIEKDELPDEAVVREVKEESGLDVDFLQETHPKFKGNILKRPFIVALEDIDREHQHIDFQYICTLKGNDKITGTEECKWFDENELDDLENCSEGIKYFAKEAINTIKSLNG
ncbi:MAG: NUDIX domain-containing protein [Candidatus Aenigmarchaeota archaeon]|nr:NUDIX domain-containing protein [Candidatus Aenigmarchaeota archaeon]